MSFLWLLCENLLLMKRTADHMFKSPDLVEDKCPDVWRLDAFTRERETPVSFGKDQMIHVGNVNIVIPFVAGMSPVPPLQNVFNL